MPSEVRFSVVSAMLAEKGYRLDRIRGSHHVFARPGAPPVVIPVHHGKVKHAYVRKIEKLEASGEGA
jgi:predicted RNA binding protein YcfA (HicA-like mRNA interferase family)